MYPSLLDADSPFELGAGTADGLSYALVGNKSLALQLPRTTEVTNSQWIPSDL